MTILLSREDSTWSMKWVRGLDGQANLGSRNSHTRIGQAMKTSSTRAGQSHKASYPVRFLVSLLKDSCLVRYRCVRRRRLGGRLVRFWLHTWIAIPSLSLSFPFSFFFLDVHNYIPPMGRRSQYLCINITTFM